MEMRERVNSMDPRDWKGGELDAAAAERLLGLVFDRLVRLDDAGQAQPGLAASWQHDGNFTHWQFQIRAGVKFHDGTAVTPSDVAAALQADDAERWTASASSASVAFEFKVPRPNLLIELATGRSFIFYLEGETVFGTGAFRIADWQPQKRLVLIASEDCWAGRSFVDRIEVGFGVAPQQQLVDLDLGRADVVEVLPNLTRRVSQATARVMASAPVDLLALVVNPNANAKAAPDGDAPPDTRLAQALSLAIDRAAIVNVLLQKQGEPAGSLLPQWLSGYAFLFPTTPNIAQAKQLVQDRQHTGQVSNMRQMALVYDGADSIAATVAERIAVNARDAGITLTVAAEKQGAASSKAELRLVRWRIDVPDAQQALQDFLARGGILQVSPAPMAIDSPEQRYAAERAAVDGGGIVPLVFLPEIFAVGPAVRDWMPPRWGGWRLEDVWLDTTPRATVAGAGGGTGNN